MKRQKISSIIVILSIIVLFTLSFAAAVNQAIVIANSTANANQYSMTLSIGSYPIFQTFNVDNTGQLTSLVVNLKRDAGMVATGIGYGAKICGITGTYGSNARPNLTDVKATSSYEVSAASIPTGWTSYTFNFNSFAVSANDKLCWVVYPKNDTRATAGYGVYIQSGSTSTDTVYPGDGGYANDYTLGTLNDLSLDMFFIIGGVDAFPTPTPATPSPNPSTYQYWNGTHWVPYTPSTPEPNIFENGTAAPYIQMLVPVILLAAAALIGWKFAGAWGFFAGLNLGAILCYAILGSSVFPLWGIIALLIIDGLLLFGKVGIRS